jgi:hypothetical protein
MDTHDISLLNFDNYDKQPNEEGNNIHFLVFAFLQHITTFYNFDLQKENAMTS